MIISWVVGVAVGIVLGTIAHFAGALAGTRAWWQSLLIGIVGAVAGRLALGSLGIQHPHLVGAIVGAIALSAIWVAAARAGRASRA